MELKIVCSCGQRYKFDVEPVNGRMPVKVACPGCGADGTQLANNILAQHFPNRPVPTVIALPQQPVAAVPATPPPPPPVGVAAPAGGLRISGHAPTPSAPGAPPPLLAAPRPIAPVGPPLEAPKLLWYHYIWIGLPLILVARGGCLGGACGGAACALNYTVFQKTSNPVLKYVWTGIISAAAFVVWIMAAALLLGMVRGLVPH